MKKKFLCGAVFFCIPVLSYGQIWITEIHHNPSGSDSGYEWVEIFNGGDGSVDVTNYKLRENETNHGIKPDGVHSDLDPGQYAVVADNTDKFKTRFPDYQGILFDSAFSLKNGGELLEMVTSDGVTVFEVTYVGATGGNDNGNSIGLVGDVWVEVLASPGFTNVRAPNTPEVLPDNETDTNDVESDETQGDEVVTQPTTPAVDVPATYIEIKNPDYEHKLIKVDAGGDRTVMAGVEYWFRGEVYGLQGGVLEDPTVRWNWGDGETGEGNPDSHRYLYPGTYTATMSSVSGKYSARDMFTVNVIDPALVIGGLDIAEQTITLTNESIYTLEISGYEIVVGENKFVLPPDSFISSQTNMVIGYPTSGILIKPEGEIVLQDKSGHIITSSNITATITHTLQEQIEVQKITETEQVTTPQETESIREQIIESGYEAPTHSVVYIEPEQDMIETNMVGIEPERLDDSVIRDQSAQILNATNGWSRYLVDILIMTTLLVVTMGIFLYHYFKTKSQRPIYDVID